MPSDRTDRGGPSHPPPSVVAIREASWGGPSSPDQRRKILLRLARLGMHFVEAGNLVIPLEQRRCRPGEANRMLIQLPHWIDHRMIVRIENVFRKFRVSRDVNLRHP